MKSVCFSPFYEAKHLFLLQKKNAQNKRAKLIFQNEPKFLYIILDFFNKFLKTWSWSSPKIEHFYLINIESNKPCGLPAWWRSTTLFLVNMSLYFLQYLFGFWQYYQNSFWKMLLHGQCIKSHDRKILGTIYSSFARSCPSGPSSLVWTPPRGG